MPLSHIFQWIVSGRRCCPKETSGIDNGTEGASGDTEMSASPPDFPESSEAPIREWHVCQSSERRKKKRIRIDWGILLFPRQQPEAINSTTVNLSSRGFYCLTPLVISAGEVLICSLAVPVHDRDQANPEPYLRCRARVIHVIPQGPNGPWGIGCAIDEYHFGDIPTGNIP